MKVKDDAVLLKLSSSSPTLDSDRYFTEEYRQLIENVLKEPTLKPKGKMAVTVPIHSTRTGLPPARK